MDPRPALLLSALAASGVLALVLVVVGWSRRATPGAKEFCATILAAAVWALAAAVESAFRDLPTMLFWANVQFVGIALLPTTWTMMAFRYVGRGRWLTPRTVAALCVIPALTIVLAWTEVQPGLVRESVSFDASAALPVLHVEFGPWFWLHAGYSYVLLLAGIVALGSSAIAAPSTQRTGPITLILGVTLPLAWNAAYLVDITPVPDLDATPLLVGVGAAIIGWGFFKGGLFGSAPIAYDKVVAALSEGIVILDDSGTIADANPAAESILGVPVETMRGRTPAQALPLSPELDDLFKNPTPPYRVLISERDGETSYCAARIETLKADPGGPQGHIIVLRDFTQRKALEEERERLLTQVQRTAAEQQATLSSIPVGLLIYDREGKIIETNSLAEKALGIETIVSLDDLGRIPNLVFVAGDGEEVPPEDLPHSKALRGESVRDRVLFQGKQAGARRCISVSAEPIRSEDGEIVGGVSTLVDITRLMTLQDERDDIMRAISHDLRTPLTVVLGHAQILKLYGRRKSKQEWRHGLEAIILASRQMNSMIRDLVDSLRMESGQLVLSTEEVDVLSIVMEIRDNMREIIDTDRIRIDVPDFLPLAIADADRVERIILNLVSNALKYSDADSEVVITFSRQDGEVVVSVSDHGQGIRPEVIDNLFGKYGNAHDQRGTRDSLGLGLYITKGLVEAHGGKIWAESQVGVGSIFHFTLPAYQDAY